MNASSVMPVLAERSLLAYLHISMWTNNKVDKELTRKVETDHLATRAGKWRTKLIDDSYLAAIGALDGDIRKKFYALTVPWLDGGGRLLPVANFQKLSDAFREYQQARSKELIALKAAWPEALKEAAARLNALFKPENYPSVESLDKHFAESIEILPIPESADIRTDIDREIVEKISRDVAQRAESRARETVEDCKRRLADVLRPVAERLSAYDEEHPGKAPFRNSLIENVSKAVAELGQLNVFGDATLQQALSQAASVSADPDALRNSSALRADVAAKATAICDALGPLIGRAA